MVAEVVFADCFCVGIRALHRERLKMNGESRVLATEAVIFPMPEKEVKENKIFKVNEIKAADGKNNTNLTEARFARLKKSLRKRSGGIL
jgi:hypothetical protein